MKLTSVLATAALALGVATVVPAASSPSAPTAAPAAKSATNVATSVATSGLKSMLSYHLHQAPSAGAQAATTSPGLGASDIWAKYGEGTPAKQVPSDTSPANTIAVVEAGSYKTTYSDLVGYRKAQSLPACTTQALCYSELGQTGTTQLPGPYNERTSDGLYTWQIETDLDVQMATAACPSCHVLVVDANSTSMADMMAAVRVAASHADYVSMSFGEPDKEISNNAKEQYAAAVFNGYPGVVFTAATSDDGYEGAMFPASEPRVIASGGTTSSNTAWNGTGTGCASYTALPSAQRAATGFGTTCSTKAETDVAAFAAPNPGVQLIIAGHLFSGVGGTSAAAPVIAGLYAMAGNHIDPYAAYAHASSFTDITSGITKGCSGSRICKAAAGWDGPTGLGQPKSPSAFAATASATSFVGSLQGLDFGKALRMTARQAASLALPVADTVKDAAGDVLPVTALKVASSGLPAGIHVTTLTSGGKITGVELSGTPTSKGSGTLRVLLAGVTAHGTTPTSTLWIPWTTVLPSLYTARTPSWTGALKAGHTVRVRVPQLRGGSASGPTVRGQWTITWSIGGRIVHRGKSFHLPASARSKRLTINVVAKASGYQTRHWRASGLRVR